MTVTGFDPALDLVMVQCRAIHGDKIRRLRLVVDTGSVSTILLPRVIESLGYTQRDAIRRTSVISPLGREHGYVLIVERFSALGFALNEFPVNVFELAASDGIDGLLGQSFLRRFDYAISSSRGRILTHPAIAEPRRA